MFGMMAVTLKWLVQAKELKDFMLALHLLLHTATLSGVQVLIYLIMITSADTYE